MRWSDARVLSESMRSAIPYLVAVTLIGLAVSFAMAAPLHSPN